MDEQFMFGEGAMTAVRPPLEAVVFDAGGTLVRMDYEWIADMLGELGVGATADQVRHGEVHGRRRYDAAAGARPNTPALGLHPPLGSIAPTRGQHSAQILAELGATPQALQALQNKGSVEG